jgi:hypothetical protein
MKSAVRIAAAALVAGWGVAALPAAARAQERIPIAVGRAVDTTDVDKRAVLALWTDYLDSRPDAMWSNPEWNAEKNRFWLDFDLTAPFVYRFGSDTSPGTLRPTVMAIQREGKRYSIRTLFWGEGLDGSDDGPDPWAIVRVYAERVDGMWRLRNALEVETESWNRPAIGKITFVSPPSHDFDIRLARRSVAFCDSLSELFPFFKWGSFDFYVANRPEDVDRVIGLEYYRDGFPRVRAMRSQDILITGEGSEWCPRGLVRMVAVGPGLVPHPIVEQGFVGWAGGWSGRSYQDNMRDVAAFMAANDSLSFQDYVGRDFGAQSEGTGDFPGAVICDMVFAAAGAAGIEALFEAGRSDEDLYRAIQSATGLDRMAFQRAWRSRILAFGR